MRDREGDALYVGKAANLRRRVRSYFGPGGRHGRLIGRALEELESLDHETCGSEFAALLREDRLIKELRPPCNRRGAGGGGAYLKLTLAEDAPRLYAVARPLPDGAAYFGPVRSQRLARGAVTGLRLLYGVEGPDTALRRRRPAPAAVGEPGALGRPGPAAGGGRAPGARSPWSPAIAPLPAAAAPRHARRPRPGAPGAGQPGGAGRARRGGGRRRGVLRRRRGGAATRRRDGRVVAGARPAGAGDRPARVAPAAAAAAVAVLDELGIVEDRLRDRAARAPRWSSRPAGTHRRSALAAIGRARGRAGRDAGLAVRAAAALALSGRYAPFGRQAAAGLRAWADGCGARLRIEDDRSDPAESARLLPGLARAADLTFGPYGSGPARRGRRGDGRAARGRLEPRRRRGAPHRRPRDRRAGPGRGVLARAWPTSCGRPAPTRARSRSCARPGASAARWPAARRESLAAAGARPLVASTSTPAIRARPSPRRGRPGPRWVVGGGRAEDDLALARSLVGTGMRPAWWCAAWPSPATSWATP